MNDLRKALTRVSGFLRRQAPICLRLTPIRTGFLSVGTSCYFHLKTMAQGYELNRVDCCTSVSAD
jgi:hypothetical protein